MAFAPLLVLATLDGNLAGVQGALLRDYALLVRLLFAVPVFLIAEPLIDPRVGAAVAHFTDARLVPDAERARFDAAVARASSSCGSVWHELLVLALVGLTAFGWITSVTGDGSSNWYATARHGEESITAAGWWYVLFGLPLFQFLAYRWLWRMLVWGRLLVRVSALELRLSAAHPDRVGGLGFLGRVQATFRALLLVAGALLAGEWGRRIAYEGASALDFTRHLAVFVTLGVVIIVAPLLAFVPRLRRLRLDADFAYGRLAASYTQRFDATWVLRASRKGEVPLDAVELSSLADLQSAVSVSREMRLLPIDGAMLAQIVGAALIPVLPVIVTEVPVGELLLGIAKALL